MADYWSLADDLAAGRVAHISNLIRSYERENTRQAFGNSGSSAIAILRSVVSGGLEKLLRR
ncbi:hypothetical protein HYU15_03360 [Candidatus Woesearchaeota archaeon]|nr:hypothetical protein [Candidatus Woesearchaeota archaeon]